MKIRTILLNLLAVVPILNIAAQGDMDVVKLKTKMDVYLQHVKAQPDWLTSRLQMYWKTHATDVYIEGETFDHPGGNRAPVATVKFCGTRGGGSAYDRPSLENIVPYDDDEQGDVTFINASNKLMEKAHPSKTGGGIGSINRQILSIANDASKIYAATGDTAYARMAFDVFDTYIKGIYYRNVPQDLTHGHMQTLVGMQTFEVIHEDCLAEICAVYTNLRKYIGKDRSIYDAAIKKWAENIIANGVPHNNWDLFQAEYIFKAALVLGDDDSYADHRGRQYYIDYVINQNSVRQWSMKKLADYGFDKNTFTWYESPGYSLTVLNDFADFMEELDLKAGVDLLKEVPQLPNAIKASAQYLFPSRIFCGFGDSHPAYLRTDCMNKMIDDARRHGDNTMAQSFTDLRQAVLPEAKAADIERYVSPSFYAPNVSWLVQRSGMSPRHDLMISLNGSLGNHQHANGISMELYGKGYVLGPDGGIGKYLYSGDDYKEYYSQFPAHNTVCVDGVSTYAVMMSQHAFKLVDRYPISNATFGADREPCTYSVLSFVEPESLSDQQRTNGIVKTSDHGGYYVDIFRSRKQDGGDKFHDYFYHNLGQSMTVTDVNGKPLDMTQTNELVFAGGHLYAYSYLYDKKGVQMTQDTKTTFTTKCKDGSVVNMTMWMKLSPDRKIIQCKSPVNMEYDRIPNEPYKLIDQPVMTFVARQMGEAWKHPFVAVYEPTSDSESSDIESVSFFTPKSKDSAAVGICVKLKSGRTDYIFSSSDGSEMAYKRMKVSGRYVVVSDNFELMNNKFTIK